MKSVKWILIIFKKIGHFLCLVLKDKGQQGATKLKLYLYLSCHQIKKCSSVFFFFFFIAYMKNWTEEHSTAMWQRRSETIFRLLRVEWKQGPEGTSDFLGFYEIFVKHAALSVMLV